MATTRERKRTETRRRIALAAVELTSRQGIAATTVDEIAREAGIGRATFFRYFESKELAVATGLSDVANFVLTATIAAQPAHLGPVEAVAAAHHALSVEFASRREMFREQAELSRSSPAMVAWTLLLYLDWEVAIAEALAPRFEDLTPGDPRPRMVGAMTMAAARLACDEWIAGDAAGDLPAIMQRYITAI